MRPIVTDRAAWSVGLSVTVVSPAKNNWTAEDTVWVVGWGGFKELRSRLGPDPHVKDNLGGKGHPL